MNNKRTIVLTGGGSGGHVIPCIALLPELNKTFDKIYYVGGCGIERKIATDNKLAYREISAVGLSRKKVLINLKIPFVLLKSICDCKRIFKEIKPDVVFGKGGYVSLPPVIAARLLRIPAVVHESDLTLGLANKIAWKLGATVLTGFAETASLSSKFIYTGAPLRDCVLSGDKDKIIKTFNLNTTKKTLLIVGGSLGAKSLNKVVYEALPTLTKGFNVVHITGKGKNKDVKLKGYFSVEYADNIGDFYAAADVVVSRAGAGAVTEISALKKAAVFIPLPLSASRGDQLKNAELAKLHGARVILQETLTPERLVNAVLKSGLQMTPVTDVGNRKISNILTAFADKHISR